MKYNKYKYLPFILIAFACIFSGCAEKETEAEKFLAANNDEALLGISERFEYIRFSPGKYDYSDYNSSADIDPEGMLLFYTTFADVDGLVDQFYMEDVKEYQFPIAEIQAYVARYFDEYVFKPEELEKRTNIETGIDFDIYDKKVKKLD